MKKDEWKDLFNEQLRNDWKQSGSQMSFDNWCDEMWNYRNYELDIDGATNGK